MTPFGDRLKSIVVRSRNWALGLPRSSAKDAIAILALIGLFIAVYSIALREPAGSDDCSYFQSVAGKKVGAAHHHQRYVLLASTWLAQAVFGYTLTGYYALSFCYSLGLVVVSYLLARCFAGPLLSFVAAVMVLALPDFLHNASLLMPDVPGQFWLTLGLFAFVKFFAAEPPVRPLPWAALSSFAFFCAASVKESLALALLGLVCFPLAFVRSKDKWLRFAYVAGGVAVLEGVQTLILWAVYGDPLYRLHAVSSGHLPQMEYYARTPGKMPQHIDWSHLSTRFLDMTNAEPAYSAGPLLGYWHLLLGSLVVALGAVIWKRNRLLLGFAPFLLAAYATLTFTIVSLDPLIPVVRTIGRYFLLVLSLLPIFIVAGWSLLLGDLSQRFSTKRARIACTALLGLVCLSYTLTAYASAAYHLADDKFLIRNGAKRVAQLGNSVRRYVQKHPEIKRILGPKPVRGGDFSWGLDRELLGVRRESLERLAKQKNDLLIDQEPALMMQAQNLIWRRVGKSGAYTLAHIGVIDDPHPAGEWETLCLSSKELTRSARASLAVHLEVRATNVRLDPLEVVVYGKRTRTLERKDWTRDGDTYSVDLESKPFWTSKLKACALRLTAKGRGTFEILEREVTATQAKSAASLKRPARPR